MKRRFDVAWNQRFELEKNRGLDVGLDFEFFGFSGLDSGLY